MARELSLRAFRSTERFLSFLSVGLVVLGIWLALEGLWPFAIVAVALGVGALAAGARLRIRPEPGSERVLILVSKRECLLCAEAKTRLALLVAGRPFRIEEHLIEDEAGLARRYRDWVPVLLWQHEELAKGSFDWPAVEGRLSEIEARIRAAPSTTEPQRKL